MPNIYFWRNALGDHDLLEEHRDTIRQLLSGDFASADLEKLSGHNIYSFRLNGKGRLLFTDHVVDGKNYLLILDHLPNHEYKNSSFLKKGILARYREQKAETLTAEARAIECSFATTTEKPRCLLAPQTEDFPELKAIPLNYFNEQFIELSAIQEKTHRVTLPLVLSGIAGSGKSSTLLSLAIEQALSYEKTVLYVAQSKILLDEMEKNWQEHPRYNPKLILFKTYEEVFQIEALIKEAPRPDDSASADESPANQKLFETWYQPHLQRERKVNTVRPNAASAAIDNTLPSETAWRELRICGGYLREAYIELGQKKSALNSTQRLWLYDTYEKYLRYLEQNGLTDSALQKPTQKPTAFYRVFVDEAHDFSQIQLEALLDIAEHGAIVYCIDSHQMLYDVISNRAHLIQQLFEKLRREPAHIELPISYRCPAHIAKAVDVMISWKQRVLGLADKFEARSIGPSMEGVKSPGQLHVISRENPSPEVITLIQEHAQTIDFAVVTTEENRKAAATWLKKHGMKASRIFTPEEIKGLQYHTVLVLDMCADKSVFTRIKNSEPVTGETAQTVHRAKKDKADTHTECHDAQFIRSMNGLIIACTRATKTLILCNELSHFNKELIKTLTPTTIQPITKPTKIEATSADYLIKSTSADYLQQAIQLYNRKLIRVSDGIFEHHLNEADRRKYLDYKKTQEKTQAAPQPSKPALNPKNTATTATAGTSSIKSPAPPSNIKKTTPNSHEETTSKKPAFKFNLNQVRRLITQKQSLDSICNEINENLDMLIHDKAQKNDFLQCLKFTAFKTAVLATTISKNLSTHAYLKTEKATIIHDIILQLCKEHPEFLLELECYELCLSSGK